MENRHNRRMQAATALPSFAVRHPSRSRWTVILFGVFALAIQCFVVQTHVHITPAQWAQFEQAWLAEHAAAGDQATVTHHQPPKDRYPAKEDPANCPLCRELALAGHFVMPVAAVVVLPVTVDVHPVSVAVTAVAVRAPCHDWRGRAPPIA